MSRGSKQKTAILRVLMETATHPQADWVYERVREEIPGISLGTVYRNLRQMAISGQIQQLDLGGGTCRYDGDTRDHYHFRCERCGQVLDIDEPTDNQLDEKLKRMGLIVNSRQFEFRGICQECQNKM